MLFKEIVGQEKIKKALIQSVKDNRISHAQLFLGQEGSGKLPLAIAYARYITCENKLDEDACGQCIPCKQYDKLVHPDLHFAFPVATSKTVSKDPVSDDYIDQWREFFAEKPYANLESWYEHIGIENKQGIINKSQSQAIIKKLNFKSFSSEYKIMIVWMAEKMNASAANKLLKILEEPPEKTVFILIAENTEPILPTILSRTQIIKISKIEGEKIAEAITQKFELNDSLVKNIVRLANGNYHKALSLMDESDDNNFNFEMFTRFMRLCYGRKVVEIINWVDEISTIGREKQKQFLKYALRLIRENFMLNLNKSEFAYLTDKEYEFSKKFFPFINSNNVFSIAEELNKAHSHITSNAYNKIVFLDLGLKLIKLIKK